ncbi:hypothetical protein K438DRAFT_1616201 [Mycena galopus ATCC 62051]|nr:hypothetical protein K438DRAFT_1616201 [Mycena galopus ATCC 62051]
MYSQRTLGQLWNCVRYNCELRASSPFAFFTFLSKPFTADFPRADLHELILMDLLHQIIKGMFKDHTVD